MEKILKLLESVYETCKKKRDFPQDKIDRTFYGGKCEAYNDVILLIKNHLIKNNNRISWQTCAREIWVSEDKIKSDCIRMWQDYIPPINK